MSFLDFARSRWAVLFVAGYAAFLFFFGLGARDLHSSHEARAAQNAQTILDEGNWLLPKLFDQHVELQKPPLYYWLVALCGWALGELNVWAVRLPAALAALGTVLWIYFLLRKLGRPVAGLSAALMLATSVHFTWLARIGRIDMPLTFAVALAVGCFFLSTRRWYLVGYLALAAGVLLKGPVALVLVAIVIGSLLSLEKMTRAHRENRPPAAQALRSLSWGVPLVLALTAPWFLWANAQTDNRIWEVFFFYHNVERALGGSETLAAYPFWYYLPRLFLDLLPWSAALPVACWWLWRRRQDVGRVSRPVLSDREARLGAVWFFSIFVLLSCLSFKRADYLLPTYPGVAILLGCAAEKLWQALNTGSVSRGMLRARSASGYSVAAMLIAVAAGWGIYNGILVPKQEQGWPLARLGRDIREKTHMPVVFFRAESHLLAFHLGRPLGTILEWENLDIWVSHKLPVYFVMPPDCAEEWPIHLTKGQLEEVCRTPDFGERHRPLVVMRSCPQ
ncbi:MAG: glycosyltransferase family 39 protein [Gemmataceae bacterium]|nr:glycosyltransferase family 39 protein [Gemmataceae bacterium]